MITPKKLTVISPLPALLWACVGLMLLSGCGPETKKAPKPIEAKEVFDGTIGSVCELTGYGRIRVQGYSLVWGLSGTGSSECPPTIRKHLLDVLRKADIEQIMGPFYASLNRNEILDQLSTAVVHVTGWIPAGAPKNAAFDVNVVALSSTQTTSLTGGKLFPIDMQIITSGSSSRALAGLPVAIASGQVFVNPFPLSGDKTQVGKADSRQGSIIGGGRSLKDRNIQLVLFDASYQLAQKVQNRINSRFAQIEDVKVANGLNRNIIQLIAPDEYDDRNAHFISLVLALYLNDRPGFLDKKLAHLSELANQDNVDYEAIALGWESIGRTGLKQLETFYKQHDGQRAFYAAKTALNLGQRKAVDPLIAIALDDQHPCQSLAASELVRVSDDPKARQALIQLLDSDQQGLRLTAYQGLRDIKDNHIRTARLPSGFTIDHVQSTGEKQLVIWLQDEPRIVLFGEKVHCPQNMFFESSDKSIVINTSAASDKVTITRQIGHQGHFTNLKSSHDLLELIHVLALPLRRPDSNKPKGAGLSFSEIVGVLYEMCHEDDQILPVKFELYRHQKNRSA